MPTAIHWDILFTNLPAIIGSLATLCVSLGGLMVSLRNSRKIDVTKEKVEAVEAAAAVTQVKVHEIKVATDGMKDALVAATRAEALLIGREEGKKAAGQTAEIATDLKVKTADIAADLKIDTAKIAAGVKADK